MREQTEAIVDAIRELEEEPPGPRTDARHRPNPSSKSSNLDWPIDHMIAPLINGMSIMPFPTPHLPAMVQNSPNCITRSRFATLRSPVSGNAAPAAHWR
jgi:hypothetical protein